MTIYNWADAPTAANHCVTDKQGIAWWWHGKPKKMQWGWNAFNKSFPMRIAYGVCENPFRGDWRESLEARPVHPCSGKCPRFDKEQCKSCLVGDE